jgi:peptidoglycan/xylan/chitin deacetylase (PgdA/CDA1 family)
MYYEIFKYCPRAGNIYFHDRAVVKSFSQQCIKGNSEVTEAFKLSDLKGREDKRRERIVPKHEIKANSRFTQICCILFLTFVLSGWASLPLGPKEAAGTFPDFVTVVAQEGDTFSSLSAKYLKDPSWGSFLAEYNEAESLRPGQPVIIPLKFDKKGGLTLRGYQTIPVLSYHNLSPSESNKMTVSQAMFDQQMRLLKEKGYRVISLDQFFDFLEFKSTLPPKSVVISVDDGWRSAYEIAFPILKKYEYPATLFIYADMITGTPKTLSWGLLQEMVDHGIDVQCHTKSHRNLTLPGKKESFKDYFANLEKELSACKHLIKRKLNREVKYLAYPYGDTNSLVIELAKKLGYRGAFTNKRGSNPFFVHNYRVNRSVVYGDSTLSQFERDLVTFQEEPLQ